MLATYLVPIERATVGSMSTRSPGKGSRVVCWPTGEARPVEFLTSEVRDPGSDAHRDRRDGASGRHEINSTSIVRTSFPP